MTDWWRLWSWSIACVLLGVDINFWLNTVYVGTISTLLLILVVDCFCVPPDRRYPETTDL